MTRLQLSVDLDYEVLQPGCEFIFNIHAAHTEHQRVLTERLLLSQDVPWRVDEDPVTRNRYLRLTAAKGPLHVSYTSTLDVLHHRDSAVQIAEVPVAEVPVHALRYLFPSRYCQSDRLHLFALREFGQQPPGYTRVQGICEWVQQHTSFTSNSTNSSTSAVDTLLETQGVCRDFAHLMIALCRAVNIPARFATGIDFGADPALGPPDFHAYVEAYLGHRWYLFDASGTAIPMGFMRFGTGRDAADVAFATIFGSVTSQAPRIGIQAVAGEDGKVRQPKHTHEALSTDA